MTKQNSVLIVGSGPTGLVMAGRLMALGVPVRLIDRLAAPVTTSRAFTIHARTLELLGQMGLIDAFVDKGIKTLSMDYHFPMKEDVPRLDFTALDSVFPFCLTINQSDTEAILRDYVTSLGVTIEWNTQLESFERDGDGGITVTLHHIETGEREMAQVDWLVGCDGFASTVRQQMNISLDGDEYGGTMRMIDVHMTGYEGSDTAVHYHIAKDHMLLINKLPDSNHRVLISDKTEGVPPEEAREAFQMVLDRHFGGKVQVDEPVWSTNFRISKRQVSSYRQGNVFLVGDSAHINSPAGGQGMNVAMQDAFNLSWKLALVLKGVAKVTLLDSYERERAPVASQMLEGTNYIHSIIMAHGKGMQERIALMQGGAWNKEAVNQVAGISYTYRQQVEGERAATLAVGDRAPDAILAGGQRLYDLIDGAGYTLFLFAGQAADRGVYERLQRLATELQARFKTVVAVQFIMPNRLAAMAGADTVVDDGEIHALYETAESSKLYILRPDYYIAYIGSMRDRDTLLDDVEMCL